MRPVLGHFSLPPKTLRTQSGYLSASSNIQIVCSSNSVIDHQVAFSDIIYYRIIFYVCLSVCLAKKFAQILFYAAAALGRITIGAGTGGRTLPSPAVGFPSPTTTINPAGHSVIRGLMSGRCERSRPALLLLLTGETNRRLSCAVAPVKRVLETWCYSANISISIRCKRNICDPSIFYSYRLNYIQRC